jgi:hypothetical protein
VWEASRGPAWQAQRARLSEVWLELLASWTSEPSVRFARFCLFFTLACSGFGTNNEGVRDNTAKRCRWHFGRRLAASVTPLLLVVAGPAQAASLTTSTAAPRLALQRARRSGIFHDGGVIPFGDAKFYGSPTGMALAAPVVAIAPTPDGHGYWLAGADGGVLAYGDARYYGSAGSRRLGAPIVTMAATPDGRGYWLVGADGAVFSFGDARYFGSPAQTGVPDPVVGFAPTPNGLGYWLVTSHGAVYSYGDARYYGSLGATNLHNIPVVAIASSADGRGYWLVQGGGEVIPYGDAPRLGGMRGHPPVAGIAVTPDGHGYWLVCRNGEVDAFGDAVYLGGNNHARPLPPITSIVADPAGRGYWLLDSESFTVAFRKPSPGPGARIVELASSQLGPSPEGGNFCNRYGPCEAWCALFATWVWEAAGVPVPRYAFVGDVYRWARRHTKVLPATARPAPGDFVLYGTGPSTVAASPHMGVVAQVWPDGEIDTIEGDAGPGPGGWTSVLVNGPFLPEQSFFANGMPIYAFAVP